MAHASHRPAKETALSRQTRPPERRNGERAMFITFLLLLIVAPLPWGSSRTWSWTLLAGGMFVLGTAWLVQFMRGRVATGTAIMEARWALGLLLSWAIYVALQLVPMPLDWLASISPNAADAYAYVGADRAPISVDQSGTFHGLLKTLFLITTFMLALVLVNSRPRARLLVAVVVANGTAQAVYGSAMVLSGLEWGFLAEKTWYIGAATGTFTNKNHFAGYLEMALGLGLGLMLTRPGEVRANSRRARLAGLLTWLTSWKFVLRLLLVIMVIGLVLSRSRMGNVAFFVGLLGFGMMGMLVKRGVSRRPFLILVVSVVLVDAFVIGKWFGFDRVVQRIEQTTIAGEQRDDVGIDVIPAIRDYWLVGSGLGTFQSVFPRYHGPELQHFWNHAHNDYLEFTLEGGLLGAGMLAAFMMLNVVQALQRCWRTDSHLRWGIAMGATMGMISLLVHSAVDFNLQIPANAMLFMTLLALLWINPNPSQMVDSPTGSKPR